MPVMFSATTQWVQLHTFALLNFDTAQVVDYMPMNSRDGAESLILADAAGELKR